MRRKVFSIGKSKGVSIPADYLGKLDLAARAEVDVTLDSAISARCSPRQGGRGRPVETGNSIPMCSQRRGIGQRSGNTADVTLIISLFAEGQL
jgi:hypothetical protein